MIMLGSRLDACVMFVVQCRAVRECNTLFKRASSLHKKLGIGYSMPRINVYSNRSFRWMLLEKL